MCSSDLYLNLIEDEVMDYIEGSTIQPPKEDAPAHAKYMKGEIRAQRILIESIKDSLIPYVSKLKSAKQIYEKLVELFSVSTAREAISLRQELYKMKLSREEGIWTTCDALDVMNLGIIKEIVLNLERTRGKRKKPMSLMKEKNLMLRDLRKRKREISIMIKIIFLFK